MSGTDTVRAPSERATLPLLSLVARGAVDEDYAVAAARRVETGVPATRPGRHLLASTGIAVFGLLIAVAAVQTARNASVESAGRSQLVQRVNERRAGVNVQKGELRTLRRGNTDLAAQSRRLGGALSGAQADLGTQQRATGFGAVSGPGLQVRVDDNPDGDDAGRVRATDLRLLINALWQSGAQAITINGRRLTTLSSLVNANIAVQVNRGPVSPPYVVNAVGPLATLPDALSETATGQAFAGLAQQFGFQVEPRTLTELDLAAAPADQLQLRDARPVPTGTDDRRGDNAGDQGGAS